MASPGLAESHVLATAAVWSRWVVAAAVLIVLGAATLTPPAASTATLVIAAIGLLAGVPHGAVDHLLATRLLGARPLAVVTAVYAGLVVVVWILLQRQGPVVLPALVALSALHFGLGELEVSRRLARWRPGAVAAAAVAVAGCGALLLPLARSGGQLQTVARAVSPGLARAIGSAPVPVLLAASWTLAAVVAIAAALRSGRNAVALDVVLIGALGMLAPPLAAFAVWFGGWHALRHTARIMTAEPGCAALLGDGRPRAAAVRLIRLAVLPSAVALTALVILIRLTAGAHDPAAALAEMLRVLLALTVPHIVVVFWLDRLSAKDFQRAC